MNCKIESIQDLEKIISEIKNGEITVKIQDSKIVFAEISNKYKLNLNCKEILGK
jgi:hypothetical protein